MRSLKIRLDEEAIALREVKKEAWKKAATKPKAKDIYGNIKKNAKKRGLKAVEINKKTAALWKQLEMDDGLKGGGPLRASRSDSVGSVG